MWVWGLMGSEKVSMLFWGVVSEGGGSARWWCVRSLCKCGGAQYCMCCASSCCPRWAHIWVAPLKCGRVCGWGPASASAVRALSMLRFFQTPPSRSYTYHHLPTASSHSINMLLHPPPTPGTPQHIPFLTPCHPHARSYTYQHLPTAAMCRFPFLSATAPQHTHLLIARHSPTHTHLLTACHPHARFFTCQHLPTASMCWSRTSWAALWRLTSSCSSTSLPSSSTSLAACW